MIDCQSWIPLINCMYRYQYELMKAFMSCNHDLRACKMALVWELAQFSVHVARRGCTSV